MADIFLSYASEDRQRVRALVGVFEAQGWSVWWDRRIQPGQSFDNVIQRELDEARCVVVVWSRHSVNSEWVKNEATIALNRGILVPVLYDRVQIPLAFIRTQAADLVGWKPGAVTAEIREVLAAVAARLGAAADLTDNRSDAKPRSRWPRYAAALAGGLLIVGSALMFWWKPIDQGLFDQAPDYSVVVSPFADNTPTYDHKWVGATIVSTLKVGLPAKGLQVISSTATAAERSSHARYRIEGTVMRLDTMLRVTAELYLVDSDRQLWADVYTVYRESISNDLSAQDEIANNIIDAVAERVLGGTDSTLVAVRPKADGGGSLQGLLPPDQAFPEFPSIDGEGANE